MRRLSALGSKQLAHRKGRSALTALGIALGVAILFGVLVSNATTQTGVDKLIADFTGKADVLVSPPGSFDATMPESVLPKLEALPGVGAGVGSYRFRSSVVSPSGADAPIEMQVTGIDLESARLIYPYTLAAGRFWREGADEVVVPQRLATKTKVKAGDRISIGTPYGVETVHLVGVLTDTGAGRTNQGDVAFTSLATARRLARVDAVYSGARLILDEGTPVEQWIVEHRDALEPTLTFQNADSLAKGFKDFLAIIGAMFTIFAALTLFVGAFLIYLTLSMAVIERTRVYGTMRALGASRGQVARVVVAEAAVLGVVSTLVGLLLGLLIAQGLLRLLANLFEIDLPGLTILPGALVAAVLVGIVTTILSSLIPARRAGRLSPVVAMKGTYGAETRLGRLWQLGIVLVLVGAAAGMAGEKALIAPAQLALLTGSVLLVPLLLRPLARVLGRLTARIAPGAGDIAVLHLVKERSRSAYTLALIMVVMGMIFSIGGLQAAVMRQLDESLDRQFGADLRIEPAGTLAPAFLDDLRALPGVGDVSSIAFASAQSIDEAGEETDWFIVVIDPATYFDIGSFAFVDGTETGARRALERGGSILLPTTAAGVHGGVGDSLRLRTREGVKPFPIAATFTELGGPPQLVMSLADAQRSFGVGDGVQSAFVNAAEGTSVTALRTRIEETLGTRYAFEVHNPSELKQEARSEIGQFFSIFYAIVLVAAIVGLLGLANTLAMSVLQRYREIGVLRAVGTTRGQIRRMVLVESATMGVAAFALSLPLGWLLSAIAVRGMTTSFGFEMSYVYPAAWIPIVALFGIIVAMLAAIAPGRRAAKLEIVNALQYE